MSEEENAKPPLIASLEEIRDLYETYVTDELVKFQLRERLEREVIVPSNAQSIAFESLTNIFRRTSDENRRLNDRRKRDEKSGFLTMSAFLDNGTRMLTSHGRGRIREILLSDATGFSQANAKLGHSEADRVMFILTHALNEKLRPEDLICRYADKGDEFAAILELDIHYDGTEDIGGIRLFEQLTRTAETTSHKIQRVAWEIDWPTVEIELSTAAIDYLREEALYATSDMVAGQRVHLPLETTTYEYLAQNPIGLDVGCLAVILDDDRLSGEHAKMALRTLIDLADGLVMSLKTGDKKPREGKIARGTCQVGKAKGIHSHSAELLAAMALRNNE